MLQEQHRIREASRERNVVEPRRRGRPTQVHAAFISQLYRLRPSDLGSMDQICAECNAKHWIGELPGECTANNRYWMKCCLAGRVKVDLLREPPAFLKDLFDDLSSRGRHFRDNIRRYNSAFAFASLKCDVIDGNVGNMPFKIHGQMYHQQGPLTTDDGTAPRYAQLYIYDPQYAASMRHLNTNEQLDRGIIDNISVILHEVNPLVRLYQHSFELLSSAAENTDDNPSVRISPALNIELISGSDRRTQNLPTSDEVAMIIPNETSSKNFRDVRIYLRNSDTEYAFTTISQNHALYIPSHYTLLFPHGDMGWHWGLTLANSQDRLKQRPYYRFRLHLRANEYPIIFKAKRLFQQYLVDTWAVCEQNKLDWIGDNQRKIRSDLYGGLEDALLGDDVDVRSTGRLILPSSFTGGPRYMAKLYQNSMAIVRHFGKPSLFITFTANPKWIEIERELLVGQSASDRPDLVARVFDLKVRELLKDIKDKKIFGSYKGLVRTVEYQKRGLPHLHLLLFLDPSLCFNNKDQIDQIISAEIPSKEDHVLYGVVTKNMVHGPCGVFNPQSPCMIKNSRGDMVCSKHFPKNFSEETVIPEDGYPIYKRSSFINNQDRYHIRNPLRNVGGQIEIDNRWIVPYNPYLSKRYNAHINVECCHSVASIKYINKYVYKGKFCSYRY